MYDIVGECIGIQRMTHMPREPEAFSEQVVYILRRHFPDKEVTLAGPMDLYLDGRHLGLNNLYRMVLSSPERGVEIVEDFLEQLLEGDDLANISMSYSLVKSRIMPRIQPNSIFEQLEREQVAYLPFVNDTSILYVIDMPRMTVSITIEQMLSWGITIDDVDTVARENLAKYQPELKLQIIEGNSSKHHDSNYIFCLFYKYIFPSLFKLHSAFFPPLHFLISPKLPPPLPNQHSLYFLLR